MTTLHEAAQQALGFVTSEVWGTTTYMDVRVYEDAAKLRDVLRAALKQEEEAAAWLAERKEHWRKEREKAQTTRDQDPELSAALGWPGGISNPVLDRSQLLQMVAALRVSSRQAQTCVWRDNLDAIYETACGNLHIVNDGTLEENGMKYCCYCGKEVKDESPT